MKRARDRRANPFPQIEVLNRQRLIPIDGSRASRLAGEVLERIGRPGAGLTIAFIRDAAMRRLNRDYRGIDKPTDVLSFAYGEEEGAHSEGLGDMVISVETARRYAEELGLTLQCELDHLVIHGTLHLAGYDHETDNGEMNALEKRLRRSLIKD